MPALHHTDNVAVGLDNGHSAATTTTNGRGLEAGSIAEAPEIIVTAPRDGNEPVAATINGRHYGPRSGLRRRTPEADRNPIVLEDVLRASLLSESALVGHKMWPRSNSGYGKI